MRRGIIEGGAVSYFELYYLRDGNKLVPPPLGALLENALLLLFFTIGALSTTGVTLVPSTSACACDDDGDIGGNVDTVAKTAACSSIFLFPGAFIFEYDDVE